MQGLITKDRKDIDPAAAPFAKGHSEIEGLGLREGASLVEVVNFYWSLDVNILVLFILMRHQKLPVNDDLHCSGEEG